MPLSIADFAGDLQAACNTAIAQGQNVYIPEGVWRLTAPIKINVSDSVTEGFALRGEGAASIIDTTAVTAGDVIVFEAIGTAPSFNLRLANLDLRGHTGGTLLRFGERDCTHAFNRLAIDGVRVGNVGRGPACEMCGIYVGRVYGEFTTAGWGGLILRQCFDADFEACNVTAEDGLALWLTQGTDADNNPTGGFVYQNRFTNLDIECDPGKGTTDAMVIDSPNAHDNEFDTLSIAGPKRGIWCNAGTNNRFRMVNFNGMPPAHQYPNRIGAVIE